MSTLNTAVSVAASALSAERTRIEVAVSNLANAESTRGTDGKPYRRRDVVLQSDTVQSFDSALGTASATGVKVARIVEDTAALRPVAPRRRQGGVRAVAQRQPGR